MNTQWMHLIVKTGAEYLAEELRRCPECDRDDLTWDEINYGHSCFPITTNTQLAYWFQLTGPEQ